MKTMRLLLTAIVVLLLPATAAEETYTIRMERPIKAGDRIKVAAKITVDSETKTTIEGRDADEEKIHASCRLQAEFTAVAVTKRGATSEIRFKVIEAECMQDGAKSDFFKAGDEIHIRREGVEYVTDINGEDPEPVQAEIMDAFLYLSDEDDVTEDVIFGTKEKVKVGAEWPMNAQALIDDWQRDGFEGLKAGDVQGSTVLVGTTEVGGMPALRLKGMFKLDAKDITTPGLPKGMKAKHYAVSASDESDLPVDVAAMESRMKMEYKLETEGVGKIEDDDGAMVNAVMKIRRRYSVETVETPIK